MILKVLTLVAVAGVLTAATRAEQNDPRRVTATASADGPNVKVRLTYQLTGGPDSVLTRNTMPASAHRRAATGPAASSDSFVVARPGPASAIAGQVCAQAKRRGLLSADICVAWSYIEPDVPPQPPVVNPPVVDTTLAYFTDSFSRNGTCSQGPGVNGFGWGANNTGGGYGGAPDSIKVMLTSSGCAMVFIHQGGPILTDDSWAEKRFTMGRVDGLPIREVFIGMIWEQDSNYVHRNSGGPNNNKLLRIWDLEYGNSIVHVGMSTLPRSDATFAQLTVEFSCSPQTTPQLCTTEATGNFSTGPWTKAFRSRSVDTVGFYAKVASAVTVRDGVIKVWWNRTAIYARNDLPLYTTSTTAGAFNGFGNGYVLGWANSGYNERTVQKLKFFTIAKAPIAGFLP